MKGTLRAGLTSELPLPVCNPADNNEYEFSVVGANYRCRFIHSQIIYCPDEQRYAEMSTPFLVQFDFH